MEDVRRSKEVVSVGCDMMVVVVDDSGNGGWMKSGLSG